MSRQYKEQKGFTVIELLIATAVFSLVLVVFLAAFLRISQIFYKGVNMSRTQETARNIVQNISDDIQFSQQTPIIGSDPGNIGHFCIGEHRYTYFLYSQVTNGTHGVVRDNVGTDCPPPVGGSSQPVNFTTATELLDPGMQMNKLGVNCANDLCTINMHVVFYGDNPDVLTPNAQDPNAQCTGAAISSQYCATADYNSTILQKF
jgi:prepilin-type N-terminal cleavage/methylation domain-containing protein